MGNLMSSLILEFAILFLRALNIDFLPIMISLSVVAVSLNDFSNRRCKREYVEPDALNEWKINILRSLILVFHLTLEIQIFYPGNLNPLFITLSAVSRIFIRHMFLVPADKAANSVAVV